MSSQTIRRNLTVCAAMFGLAVLLSASAAHRPPQTPTAADAAEIVLSVDPAQSSVHFTVGSSLHTVNGTFAVKRGTLRLDPATGKANGEIVVDAISGQSGNDSRDSLRAPGPRASSPAPECANFAVRVRCARAFLVSVSPWPPTALWHRRALFRFA